MKKIKFVLVMLFGLIYFSSGVFASGIDSNGLVNITQNDIDLAYQTYLSKYDPLGEKSLAKLADLKELNNEDGTLTDFGEQAALDLLNFYRSVNGLKPVELNDTCTYYAQAGVNYLSKYNLAPSHHAADNSGDLDAKRGLNYSNLHGYKNPIDSMFGWFSDLHNITGPNTGHRDWMLEPRLKEVGIASAKGACALYVGGELNFSEDLPVVSYPSSGLTPVELKEGAGVPLWYINFGNYYNLPEDLSTLSVNITSDSGKSIDYHLGELKWNTDNDCFAKGYFPNSIDINPYNLVDGNYKTIEGKTYTINISGLKDGKTLTYSTKFIRINGKTQTYIPTESIEFIVPEITIEVREEIEVNPLVKIIPENATNKKCSFYAGEGQIISVSSYEGIFHVQGSKKGTTQLYAVDGDGTHQAVCIVNVIEKEVEPERNIFEIKTVSNPPEGGTTTGDGSFVRGFYTRLKADPSENYRFVNWTIDGIEVNNHIFYDHLVDSDAVVTANFEKIIPKEYKIDVLINLVNAGTITGNGTYKEGESVTVTAYPNTGYKFINWKEDGEVRSSSNTYSFTARKDRTLTANFEKISLDEPSQPSEPTKVSIYRLYNESSGEHLYTPDYNEYVTLSNGLGWTAEGLGWSSPGSGTPVYRLYNPALNDHLYTTDTNEMNILTSGNGWEADYNGQPLFYSGGTTSVYRLYHDGTKRHHLTKDTNEYGILYSAGWNREGVKLYALAD